MTNDHVPGDDRLQQAIQTAKTELEHMIDLLPMGMVLLDGGGRVLRANLTWLRLLDLDHFSDVLGRPVTDLLPLVGQGDSRRLDACFMTPTPNRQEWIATLDLPGTGRCQAMLTLLPAGDNPRSLFLIVDTDVSSRSGEAATSKAQKVSMAVEIISKLAAEIQEPLTRLLASSVLIRRQAQSPCFSRTAIAAEAERIMAMVNLISEKLHNLELKVRPDLRPAQPDLV